MHLIDWILLAIPILIVVAFALKAQRYVKGVADFLSAGRVAGRYILCVASAEAGFGLISLVGIMEMYYDCGFAVSFWSTVSAPLGMLLALFGFCTYRFRETKAMTLGQFFEIRYNRPFRLTAAVIQAMYGVLNYAIFPAVGARFLIYFLDLPLHFEVLGISFSTFGVVMLLAVGLAAWIACAGGQITIMVTDCVQGILSYPIYLLIIVFFLCRFSWSEEMMPALLARPEGYSFLNAFDVSKLRNFNLVYVIQGIVGMVLFRMSWGGRGYDSSAKNAHEAKMGALLGTWRGSFSTMMFILMGVVAFTYINHAHFAKGSNEIRHYLAEKTLEDTVTTTEKDSFHEAVTALPEVFDTIEPREKFSESYASYEEYADEIADSYVVATEKALGETPEGKKKFQTFKAIYSQMLVPISLRGIFPIGIMGLFCAMMIFLMLSTDTTYLHAWSSVIVQDIIMPLQKKAMDPKRQITLIRLGIVGVGLFAVIFSFYFGQIDFIMMFFAITGAIWAASGPVITFGLYWSRGTSAGAFASLLIGAGAAICSILAQKFWVPNIYPWLSEHGLVESCDRILRALSGPMEPYVIWRMSPDVFPMTSAEVALLVNIFTILLYVFVSLATCRKPFIVLAIVNVHKIKTLPQRHIAPLFYGIIA